MTSIVGLLCLVLSACVFYLAYGARSTLALMVAVFFLVVAIAFLVPKSRPVTVRLVASVGFAFLIALIFRAENLREAAILAAFFLFVGVPIGYVAVFGKYPHWGFAADALSREAVAPGKPRNKGSLPLELQLSALAECGISLRTGITIDHLVKTEGRDRLESDPYRSLLIAMGTELEGLPNQWLSDDVWYYDVECIDGAGDYARIAMRLRDLAGKALPLEDIADHVDTRRRKATISFRLDGEKYTWNAMDCGDYVDPAIMSKFAKLLTSRQTGRQFAGVSFGQDGLLVCCAAQQLERLNELSGLRFRRDV